LIRNVFCHRYLFSMLCFLHVLLLTGYYISDSFTGDGFNESVIYILSTGLDGFDVDGYLYLLVSTLSLMLLALYLCFRIPIRFQFFQGKAKWICGLCNLVLIALIAAQPIARNIAVHQGIFINQHELTSIDISPVIQHQVQLDNKPNIIYLYAEGLERTYLDEKLFPGLAPNLRRLESKALAFTNITGVYGTGWTIAGMVASQCGLPLQPVANANKPGTFMPGAYCLGDILHENGYQQSYIGGASLRFGGKGNFYTTHHFDSVFGRDQLLEALPEDTAVSEWGIYDETLFPIIEQKLSLIKNQKSPYALIALTLDTHPPHGLPSSVCEGIVYLDGSDPMLNAVHCSDRLLAQFIENLMKTEAMDNTLIVVGSDHLSLNHTAHDQLVESAKRKNLFFILGEQIDSAVIDRFASPLDIAPTLIGLMGADIEALNLGVDLLGDRKSLMELSTDPDRDIRIWSKQLGDFY
jgi:phosphoglycerol transferase